MNQFIRTEALLGADGMERLRNARVAVFGIGGVGGYVAEALARCGIGALDLIDSDTVAESNLNRQIVALHSTIGKLKTAVAAARIKDINPDCKVTEHNVFYLPETAEQFDFTRYDYVVDAIDTVTGKLMLIEQAKAAGTPIICCLGTGNKLDPTKLMVSDIHKTSVCPLAKVIRLECRRRGIQKLKVVYSTELPLRPKTDLADGSVRRSIPASAIFVPASAGLLLADTVILDLLADSKTE